MNEKTTTRLRGEQEGWNKRRVNACELANDLGRPVILQLDVV